MDAILERAEDRLGRLPVGGPKGRAEKPAAAAADIAAPALRVGDQVRSASGGWTGRIAELDRSHKRATIEAGAMRVSVETADLQRLEGPPAPDPAAAGGSASSGVAGTNVAAIRLARARSVPMSLDVRGARVDEALSALDRYLEDASLAGLERVTVIHGLGTGALRDAVRSDSAAHPLVRAVRPGERGEGGDGVTVVDLG
jgi:DNA mismatch repair protein MutS2